MNTSDTHLRTWLWASAGAFLCCLVSTGLLVAFGPRIIQYGFAQSVFYVVLIVASLLAAGFLFGALRSYGKYKGKVLSGTLELGGPAVVSILIVLVGLFYAGPSQTFSLVVRPHGPKGQNDLLREGTITVYIGSNPRTEQVGSNGQAQFNEIPSSFSGSQVNISTDIPGYVYAEKSASRIPESRVIYVALVPERPSAFLSGRFFDLNGQPVIGARLDINDGLANGVTDQTGRFLVHVPLKEGSKVDLSAEKNGVQGYEGSVTVSSDLSLTFITTR